MSNFKQNGGMKIVINDIVSRHNITEAQFVLYFNIQQMLKSFQRVR